MAGGNINLPLVATPGTPAATTMNVYADATATTPNLRMVNAAGVNLGVNVIANGYSTVQNPAATTRTYITGTALRIPVVNPQVGSCFRWDIEYEKTGAGSATSVFDICYGTNAGTGDSARVSFTKPAGTTAADVGMIHITATVKTAGSSGVLVGTFELTHSLAATGHIQTPSVVLNTISGAFDMTVAASYVGICITAGANDVISINQVNATGWNI